MESDVQSLKNSQTAMMIHEPVIEETDFAEAVSPGMRSVEAVMREVARRWLAASED